MGVLCRYRVEGEERLFNAIKEGRGVILAFWHGRMLLPIYHFRSRGYVSLASRNRDGEYISRIATRLGYSVLRGSSHRGGREGFMAMTRELRKGRVVGIFPDGSTGPRYHLQDGVLQLARLTGAPVIPATHSASPSWQAKSWDRFMIMKPFSRGLILVGEPIHIPRSMYSEDEKEQYRLVIKQALIDIEQEADRRMADKSRETG